MIEFGDLSVMSREMPPAKLLKALAVIADRLHPVLAKGGFRTHDSCVLLSLAVRDFLQAIDFTDAVATPVTVVVREFKPGGEQGHSLGIGVPGDRAVAPERWAGHMVVTLPKCGWLIDTTLYQAARPQWPELPGMVAVR